MRTATLFAALFMTTIARGDEPTIDALIRELKLSYDNAHAVLQKVKDKETAELSRRNMEEWVKHREQMLAKIVGLNLKSVDRDAAQARLNKEFGAITDAIQKEIARISLIPDALAAVEELVIVKEMAALLESRAKLSARTLERALKLAAARDNGKYPAKLDDVGLYLADKSMLRDPWGRVWQYDFTGKQSGGTGPDVWTVSPFGGGKKVIGNWSEKK
jgi:hypothetical protein